MTAKDKKINAAVDHAITKIAVAQQNIAAFRIITQRQYIDSPYHEAFPSAAVDAIQSVLSKKLTDAWDDLAWMAPISKEAMELLAARTRSWFTQKDTQVMNFLGEYGSFYVKDEETFRKEVMAKFQEG